MIQKQSCSIFLLFVCQIDLNFAKKYYTNHYLFGIYKNEILILNNGTFPKDKRQLQIYKRAIMRDEARFRYQAWLAIQDNSRLYDELPTKSYKRPIHKKKRRRAKASEEKWERRVRFHFLKNYLLQNGFTMVRRREHSTTATPFPRTAPTPRAHNENLIPNIMKRVLPRSMYYKYLRAHTFINKVSGLVLKVPKHLRSVAQTCLETIRNMTRKKCRSPPSNKTIRKYFRKIDKYLTELERALDKHNASLKKNTGKKLVGKGFKKVKAMLKRKRRKKKFRRQLYDINQAIPPRTTTVATLRGYARMTISGSNEITLRTKRRKIRTTRRKRNKTSRATRSTKYRGIFGFR